MGSKREARIARQKAVEEYIASERRRKQFARECNRRHNGAGVERDFRACAATAGYEVSKRGWPDFVLRKDGEIWAFVEVKSHPGLRLKREQLMIAEALVKAGFRVFRWDPVSGFSRVGPA